MSRLGLIAVFTATAGCWSSWTRHGSGEPIDAGTDEMPSCTLQVLGPPIDTGISTGTGTYHHFDMQWTGSDLAIAWDEEGDGGTSAIMFTRLDRYGVAGTHVRVDDDPGNAAVHPMLEGTPDGFGVAWENPTWSPTIRLRILDADGTPAAPSTRVDTPGPGGVYGIQADMAWTGSEFALTWPYQETSPNAEGVVLVFHDPDGARMGSPVVFSEGITTHPVVVAADWNAALLWRGDGVHLSLVDPGGDVLADAIVLGPEALGRHVATDPGGFFIAYSEDAFRLTMVSASGEIGATVTLGADIAAPHGVDLTYGGGWSVVWQDGWHPTDGRSPEVRVVSLPVPGPDAGLAIARMQTGGIAEPHIAWTGHELWIVHNDRDAEPVTTGHLMLTRVGCR